VTYSPVRRQRLLVVAEQRAGLVLDGGRPEQLAAGDDDGGVVLVGVEPAQGAEVGDVHAEIGRAVPRRSCR
jgi:hypothetical protein